ncbi:MAG: sulfite exporter TauE/SafE family protein [Saprospiraceae bacterium]|nr:sulfite exporter TauE/SafE family protein [Saprospiraceae bacterium]
MQSYELFYILRENIPVMVTMIFGSFIAGSSPEGSASVAYPIFTLYLGITPDIARNFAFAIQSIGMTAASIFIINCKIPIDRKYILFVTIGGLFGLLFGTFYVVPYIKPIFAKLVFVSLWLSFGIILFLENRNKNRRLMEYLGTIRTADKFYLILFGLIGGCISAIFGTGINIFTFCFMVIYYKINEKVATPSSIIIMTIETIFGFALHALWIQDFTEPSYHMWLSCIPVVILFAPLGTYFISKISNKAFTNFLYIIFLVQYIGAIYVIRPSLFLWGVSFLIIVSGIVFFHYLSKANTPQIDSK